MQQQHGGKEPSRQNQCSQKLCICYAEATTVERASFMVHTLQHYQPGPASCRSIPQQRHSGMPVAPPHLLHCLLLAEMVPVGEENSLFYHAGGYLRDFYMYI